jgi:cellulose 1,4-beta-cellobiosidase
VAQTRTVQKIGTFVWITSVASLSNIDTTIAAARAESPTFALILEPDSLGNVVTNLAVPFCANASSGYLEGIAYSIAKFQLPNVFLYVDAAHRGWLG